MCCLADCGPFRIPGTLGGPAGSEPMRTVPAGIFRTSFSQIKPHGAEVVQYVPMGKVRTHYDNLRVPRTADQQTIKAAFRSLSQKHHPDKHPDDREKAEEIFKIINRAYEVLSDPVKRREHDEWIAREEGRPAAGIHGGASYGRAGAGPAGRRYDHARRGPGYGPYRESAYGAKRGRHHPMPGQRDSRSSSILKAMVLCKRVESSGGMIAFISMLSGVLAAATYAIVTLVQ